MKKSVTYKGVYQTESGKWFYRLKQTIDGQIVYKRIGGFHTELLAYEARQKEKAFANFKFFANDIADNITFGEVFDLFIKSCKSNSTIKKYQALYNAQLKFFEKRYIIQITDGDIYVFLLNLTLKGAKDSYIDSIRKLMKKIFVFSHENNPFICEWMGNEFDSGKKKLKMLSLFSGIGAPEEALKNLGIDFELVNYCEYSPKAAKAYSILHNIDESKNLVDVQSIYKDYSYDFLPDFDLVFFGFPCQDLSNQGNQAGFSIKEMDIPLTFDLFDDSLGELTRSGLFYRAFQVIAKKKPKFAIAENVSGLLNQKFIPYLNGMIKSFQDIGYNVYINQLNSKDYGVPQNRKRVFLIFIRSDINMTFDFPKPIPLEVQAQDWFEHNVAEEYYVKQKDVHKLYRKSFKPNFKRDIITCITTNWGRSNATTQQTYIQEVDRYRCLTSEELMRFQGFKAESGTILRDNGYNKGNVGKLVGNSITVNVLEQIFSSLIEGFSKPISVDYVPQKIITNEGNQSKIDDPFFDIIKDKMTPAIEYLLPMSQNLRNVEIIDLSSDEIDYKSIKLEETQNRKFFYARSSFDRGIIAEETYEFLDLASTYLHKWLLEDYLVYEGQENYALKKWLSKNIAKYNLYYIKEKNICSENEDTDNIRVIITNYTHWIE